MISQRSLMPVIESPSILSRLDGRVSLLIWGLRANAFVLISVMPSGIVNCVSLFEGNAMMSSFPSLLQMNCPSVSYMSPMAIFSSFGQPRKRVGDKESNNRGRVTCLSSDQLANASVPISRVLWGMSIIFRDLQSANAHSPISVTPSCNSICVRFLHPAKA